MQLGQGQRRGEADRGSSEARSKARAASETRPAARNTRQPRAAARRRRGRRCGVACRRRRLRVPRSCRRVPGGSRSRSSARAGSLATLCVRTAARVDGAPDLRRDSGGESGSSSAHRTSPVAIGRTRGSGSTGSHCLSCSSNSVRSIPPRPPTPASGSRPSWSCGRRSGSILGRRGLFINHQKLGKREFVRDRRLDDHLERHECLGNDLGRLQHLRHVLHLGHVGHHLVHRGLREETSGTAAADVYDFRRYECLGHVCDGCVGRGRHRCPAAGTHGRRGPPGWRGVIVEEEVVFRGPPSRLVGCCRIRRGTQPSSRHREGRLQRCVLGEQRLGAEITDARHRHRVIERRRVDSRRRRIDHLGQRRRLEDRRRGFRLRQHRLRRSCVDGLGLARDVSFDGLGYEACPRARVQHRRVRCAPGRPALRLLRRRAPAAYRHGLEDHWGNRSAEIQVAASRSDQSNNGLTLAGATGAATVAATGDT